MLNPKLCPDCGAEACHGTREPSYYALMNGLAPKPLPPDQERVSWCMVCGWRATVGWKPWTQIHASPSEVEEKSS